MPLTTKDLDESHPPAGVPAFYKTESAIDDPWPPVTKFLLGQLSWWSVPYIALWAIGFLQYSGTDLVIWLVGSTVIVLALNFLATLAFPIFQLQHSNDLVAGFKTSWLALAPGESVVRDDLVMIKRVEESNLDKARLGRMVLTNRRIALVPAEFPWWYSPAAYLSSVGPGTPLIPPLLKPRDLPLRDIERFWTWQPPFSAAPALQVGDELTAFALRMERGPWQSYETPENVKSHFEEIEATWEAAKAGVG